MLLHLANRRWSLQSGVCVRTQGNTFIICCCPVPSHLVLLPLPCWSSSCCFNLLMMLLFIAFIITLFIIQNVYTTRVILCGFLFCKVFKLTSRINSIWRDFLFSIYFCEIQEFSGHIKVTACCGLLNPGQVVCSCFESEESISVSEIFTWMLSVLISHFYSSGNQGLYRSLLYSKAEGLNLRSFMTNKNCWAGIINAFFSPGKKKTQEGKNKGKKATDTKQKKADLDSTSADMRDSKESEFSVAYFFLLFIFLNQGMLVMFSTLAGYLIVAKWTCLYCLPQLFY